MAVGVVIEYVDDGKIACRYHKATPVDAAGQLIGVGLDLFPAAAKADGLAQEQTGTIEVLPRSGCPRDFTIAKSTQPGQA